MGSVTGDSVFDVMGFVLAGGRSSRMGSDKGLVELEGRPLIEWAIGTLQAAGIPVRIAGAREEVRGRLEEYAAVVPDAAPGHGPLAGICAGLSSTMAAHAVFLPVDVPLMPPALIRYLIRHAQITGAVVTVASVNGLPQTFPAVIARGMRPALDKRLRNRELGCLAAFEAAAVELGQKMAVIPAEVLVQCGQVAHPDALSVIRWFMNVNTGPDLRLASSMRQARVS